MGLAPAETPQGWTVAGRRRGCKRRHDGRPRAANCRNEGARSGEPDRGLCVEGGSGAKRAGARAHRRRTFLLTDSALSAGTREQPRSGRLLSGTPRRGAVYRGAGGRLGRMEVASVVLGVIALGACVAGAWALRERGRCAAERELARAERDAGLARAQELERSVERKGAELERLRDELTGVERDRAGLSAQLAERTAAAAKREEEFESKFRALAQEVMLGATRQLKQDAAGEIEERRKAVESMVRPIAETLQKTDEKIAALQRERTASDAALREHLRVLSESSGALRDQTGKLVQALRRPEVRGSWGEVQLQSVVELAGMREYCDFDLQSSSLDDEGRRRRPDLVVRLPNGRCVAVDAKTNIDAYMSAISAPDSSAQDELLEKFADHAAQQIKRLGAKDYGSHLEGALDFVVMFVPGDQFVDAALRRRPDLIEVAARSKIILATPSTLIGLLRAIQVGWREKTLSDRANELFELGAELHDRAATALGFAGKVGSALQSAIKSYNQFAASVDSRLMPTLIKFEKAGAKSSKELEAPAPIEALARTIASAPFLEPRAADGGFLRGE